MTTDINQSINLIFLTWPNNYFTDHRREEELKAKTGVGKTE